jgi:hypothetical protein
MHLQYKKKTQEAMQLMGATLNCGLTINPANQRTTGLVRVLRANASGMTLARRTLRVGLRRVVPSVLRSTLAGWHQKYCFDDPTTKSTTAAEQQSADTNNCFLTIRLTATDLF